MSASTQSLLTGNFKGVTLIFGNYLLVILEEITRKPTAENLIVFSPVFFFKARQVSPTLLSAYKLVSTFSPRNDTKRPLYRRDTVAGKIHNKCLVK